MKFLHYSISKQTIKFTSYFKHSIWIELNFVFYCGFYIKVNIIILSVFKTFIFLSLSYKYLGFCEWYKTGRNIKCLSQLFIWMSDTRF